MRAHLENARLRMIDAQPVLVDFSLAAGSKRPGHVAG